MAEQIEPIRPAAVPAHPAAERRSRTRIAATAATAAPATLVAIAYLGLVLLLWLPFGYRNGMAYELAFPWSSETQSFLHGFIYSDPLRPYTSVFYQLGYKLSAAIGLGGSFLGYQLVYAALWWARGLLAYLIMDVVLPGRRVLATLVGALVLVHASDHALNWVGQMNQFGMMFWTLLGLYALALALRSERRRAVIAALLLAMLFTRLALWSYESPIFIIALVPVLLLGVRYNFTRRNLLIVGVFYLVPLLYVLDTVRRYRHGGAGTYQASVLRKDMAVVPMLRDLWFNVEASLKFWDWGMPLSAPATHADQVLLSWGGAGLFAAVIFGGALLVRRGAGVLLPRRRTLVGLLAIGLLLMILSFPAYLVLSSARQLWRTQFLSGIGTGLALAAAIGLLATFAPRYWLRVAVIAATGAVVVWFGVGAAFEYSSYHHAYWVRDKTAIDEVLQVAPRVRPGTLIVLEGVPPSSDPFYDNLWFDLAMRLAYPGTTVAGVYFYTDGRPAPDINMALRGGSWHATNQGLGSLLATASLQNTIVVRYSPGGKGALARMLPAFLVSGPVGKYDPTSRIVHLPVSERVRNRYGPDGL